jgi:plasmid stabilization system protein ParE
MTTKQGFALHPLAAQEIIEIWEYCAADSPIAAAHLRKEIYTANAVWFGSHRKATPDRTLVHFRCASSWVREYLIAYAPEEQPLWVIAVMHGRRSPRVMGAIHR